ncbi:hypothetical protein Zmor_025362 [Zophobas morio]|uniref:Uncharacterized protein n=1 Tax=Zophobas morio TaxID=2755281 RepID=A0AA38HRL2_9CUCU|nr:hypothetical protein Zmor_025362 [Zophobas morio]
MNDGFATCRTAPTCVCVWMPLGEHMRDLISDGLFLLFGLPKPCIIYTRFLLGVFCDGRMAARYVFSLRDENSPKLGRWIADYSLWSAFKISCLKAIETLGSCKLRRIDRKRRKGVL